MKMCQNFLFLKPAKNIAKDFAFSFSPVLVINDDLGRVEVDQPFAVGG